MMKIYLFLSLVVLLSLDTYASKKKAINSKAINIDGHFNETKNEQVDEELKSLRSELKNVKNLKRNYNKKQKMYGKLVQESEGLKEGLEGYLEQRDEWNSAIGEYNTLLECTKNKAAKDCLKKPRKKKQQAGNAVERERSLGRPAAKNSDPRSSGLHPVQKWERDQHDMEMDSITMNAAAPVRSKPNMNNYITMVDHKVAGKAFELNYCYRKSKTKQEGILPVMLKIGQGGRLDHLSFIDTTQVYNKRLISCLTRVLYNIDYPKSPTGNKVAIKKVFTFELHHI